jgi:hypothetical protein
MAYWIFKCNPERYKLEERLADANPTTTWLVTRYRNEIGPGDIVFLWQTGVDRGIRAVIRVDEAPKDMRELEHERPYWTEPDDGVQCRIVGTLTHRAVNLGHEYLRGIPGLAELSVFRRNVNQQAPNFEVTPEEGAVLMSLIEDASWPIGHLVLANPPFSDVYGIVDGQQWLDRKKQVAEDVTPLLKQFPAERMQLVPVSTLVNSPRNEYPRCVEAVAAVAK